MLERWEFIQFPCTKDPNRYKLKVKSAEEELYKLIKMLGSNTGRPFASLSHEFNWGVYFYGVTVEERNRVVDTLKKICSDGGLSQSGIQIGQELSPIFEEFLEATAKELAGGQEKSESSGKLPEKIDLEPIGPGGKAESKPEFVQPDREPAVEIERSFFGDNSPKAPAEEDSRDELRPVVERFSSMEDEKNQNKNVIFGSHIQQDRKETEAPEKSLQEEKAQTPQTYTGENEKPPVIEEEPPKDEPVVKYDEPAAAVQEEKPEEPSAGQFQSVDQVLILNTRYTMAEFVVGPNNRFTHAAAKAVADNPGKIYNPLFIYGGVGLGKTHLMHAVGHVVLEKNPHAKIMYVTTEKFMSEVIESIGKGSVQEFREKYRKIDLLLIDDIQFLTESESTQEEFFHTFNTLHENSKQIIITSDRPPKQLATLEDRLRSRFEWGLIADIKSPSLETRVAILKKKSETGDVNLDENMLLYIAGKLKSNIRELEGFLKRINAYAALTGQEVNMDLVKSVMRELLPEEDFVEDEIRMPGRPVEKPQVVPVEENPAAVQPQPVVEEPKKPPVEYVIPKPAAVPQKPPPAPAIPPKPVKNVLPAAPSIPVSGGLSSIIKDDVDPSLVPIEVAFFYPEAKESEFNTMKDKFRQVIRKHKLKFRFESIFEKTYDYNTRINYAFFTELCKTNAVRIAVVLGAPPNQNVASEDFSSLLGAMMEDEKISMQYVAWSELNKDYKYLNLALDITLLKNKKGQPND